MNEPHNCSQCPAFGSLCAGSEDADRCVSIESWIDILGGLELDMDLLPQPAFYLPVFFPQLLNGLEVPSVMDREATIGVGIAKVLTPRGQVSRRALTVPYGVHNVRTQWGISENATLICIGNTLDPCLERLWSTQMETEDEPNIWGRIQTLGFDAATSLNYSLYLDRPRLEHLVNIKRSWLTVQRMQQTSGLIPIPHLQWATPLDMERQLDYALAQGVHTLTLNLQMFRRQGWEVVTEGLAMIRKQAPDLRFLITGVAGLKRMTELAAALHPASFTNTTVHFLAQRHVRLQRDGSRLIKDPVDGHPDLILAENVQLYREFLDKDEGIDAEASPIHAPNTETPELVDKLVNRLGFETQAAEEVLDLLAVDEAILNAFTTWLQTGELDPGFQGSFPACGVPLPLRWPCAESVPQPTLGELLDQGADPVEALLYLAYLAHQVDEEIQVFVGQAGY